MKTAYIDFDHTISPVHFPFPLVDAPHKDCKATIEALIARGYKIIIWSCRANPNVVVNCKQATDEMIAYLKKHQIHFDEVATNKPNYTILIDDKAGFSGNWEEILMQIKQ